MSEKHEMTEAEFSALEQAILRWLDANKLDILDAVQRAALEYLDDNIWWPAGYTFSDMFQESVKSGTERYLKNNIDDPVRLFSARGRR